MTYLVSKPKVTSRATSCSILKCSAHCRNSGGVMAKAAASSWERMGRETDKGKDTGTPLTAELGGLGGHNARLLPPRTAACETKPWAVCKEPCMVDVLSGKHGG